MNGAVDTALRRE